MYQYILLLNFAGCAMLACPTASAENSIRISQQYIDNLGIQMGKAEAVTRFPVLSAPAKVAIPPAREYIVSASQLGLIEQLNAAIGDKVVKGQILAQINSPDLLTLQREYLKADSTRRVFLLNYNRDKELLKEGVISDRRWQETSSQYHSAVSELDEHRQLLEIAGMTASEIARLAKTHRLSRQLHVRAPISGVVLERLAVAGTRIDMMAPLYRIANLDELWLEIAIPQERMDSIKIGDRVVVENPVGATGRSPSAKITLLGQSVNPDNQTVMARAVIEPQNDALLRPGQRLNTRIIQASDKAVFKIPNTAIAKNEGNAYIFIRKPQGFLVTPITVVGNRDNQSIVSGELSADDEIAVNGAVALKANWLGLGSDQ